MKAIYKLMIFLAVFQIMPLTINSLGVFPEDATFYQPSEDEIVYINEDADFWHSAEDIFANLFVPDVGQDWFASTTIMGIMLAFVALGSIVAAFTHNYTLIPILFQGYMVSVMLSRSWRYFGKLFTNWDVTALMYLLLIFLVVIIIFVVITMMETATHGDV